MKNIHNNLASLAGGALLIAVVLVVVISFSSFRQIEGSGSARKH